MYSSTGYLLRPGRRRRGRPHTSHECILHSPGDSDSRRAGVCLSVGARWQQGRGGCRERSEFKNRQNVTSKSSHASPTGPPRLRPTSRDAERPAMLGAALLALAPAMVANVPPPRLSAVLFDVREHCIANPTSTERVHMPLLQNTFHVA